MSLLYCTCVVQVATLTQLRIFFLPATSFWNMAHFWSPPRGQVLSPASPDTVSSGEASDNSYEIKPAAHIDVTLRWGTDSSMTVTVLNTMDLKDFREMLANHAEFPNATADQIQLVLDYDEGWLCTLVHGELRKLRVEHGSVIHVRIAPRRRNKRTRDAL